MRLSGARFSGSFVWGADGGQVYVASTTTFIHDDAIKESWKPFDLMSGATIDMQGAPLASLPGSQPGYMYNGRTAPWPGPPTVSSFAGLGTGTAVVAQGHDFAGVVELRPEGTASSRGEVVLRFNHSLGATSASSSLTVQGGSGQWASSLPPIGGVAGLDVTQATPTSLSFLWSNGGEKLLGQKTYRIGYQCQATCGYSDPACKGTSPK